MYKIEELFKSRDKYTYIIAEISQTHDGSLGQAHAFIDAVATTGADAIKFQTHIADEESTIDEPFRVKFSYEDKTRYDYWKRMEFTEEQWLGLYEHAVKVGLDFLSSAFSIKALNILDRIGVPAWKFGSGEVFNTILLNRAISTKKPIILSTGMSTFSDIDEQVKLIKEAGNSLVLMQCTTAYPCPAENIGINLITELQEKYHCHVGLSDHSSTIYPSLAAATLGASVVEVHVTMSRHMFGPDVSSSVTIEELKTIVDGVRFINKMNNNPYDKSRLSCDLNNLKHIFSKSIYIVGNLEAGDVLKEENISIKKPGTGIPSSEYGRVIGKTLRIAKNNGTMLQWEDLY